MIEINCADTQEIGGGFSLGSWAISQLFTAGVTFAWNAVVTGQVDYTGISESQGTYYNMVGA